MQVAFFFSSKLDDWKIGAKVLVQLTCILARDVIQGLQVFLKVTNIENRGFYMKPNVHWKNLLLIVKLIESVTSKLAN